MQISFENTNSGFVNSEVLTDDVNYTIPDLTYLRELSGGDEIFVKEMIAFFIENTPEKLNLMKEYALSGDHEKLRFAAHKLLSDLAFVGLPSAFADIKKIENESKFMDDLSLVIERVIKTIYLGINDLKKMI